MGEHGLQGSCNFRGWVQPETVKGAGRRDHRCSVHCCCPSRKAGEGGDWLAIPTARTKAWAIEPILVPGALPSCAADPSPLVSSTPPCPCWFPPLACGIRPGSMFAGRSFILHRVEPFAASPHQNGRAWRARRRASRSFLAAASFASSAGVFGGTASLGDFSSHYDWQQQQGTWE